MELCRYGSGAFFAAGGAFLILKLSGAEGRELLLLSASGIFLTALILSLCHAYKTLPDEEKLTIYLSSLVPGGGVLLSARECGAETDHSLPLPPLPRCRYTKGAARLGILLAGVCFAFGMFCVPLKTPETPSQGTSLDLKDEKEKFSKVLDALRRSGPEGEKKALPLQKELEETLRKADPAAPGRSYELLYALNKRLRKELAAEELRSAGLLGQMESVRQSALALSRSGRSVQNGQAFSQLLKTLSQKNPQLGAALKRGGFKGGALSDKELEKLADSLGRDAEGLKRNMQEMSSYLENGSQRTSADLQNARRELEEFIKENVPGCDDLIESLTNRDDQGEPGTDGGAGETEPGEGTGTPARGRGDAVLEYSGFTPEYGAKKVDRKVRSHLPGSRKESILQGRFAVDSKEKVENIAPRGGNLQSSAGYGGYQESDLHPAHRRAVKRYFERKRKP